MKEGLFERGSAIRRVNRESVLLLVGVRALLLQLAHPLVAAGVAGHSNFRRDPLGRLWRTLDPMLRIVFGDRDTALAAAERIDQVHHRVRGSLAVGTAAFPAGTPYDARDPALLLWVWATLVDSALVGYQRLVAGLAPSECWAYYDDSRQVARLLGVPAARLPPSFDELQVYLRDMISGPCLEVTPAALELAHAVLHPPVPLLSGFGGDALSAVSLALLPPEIRDRYGLSAGPARRLAEDLAVRAIRCAVPLLPYPVRFVPHAWRSEWGRIRLRRRPAASNASVEPPR
jgi:uncharacterized protein (DUF2236 family)